LSRRRRRCTVTPDWSGNLTRNTRNTLPGTRRPRFRSGVSCWWRNLTTLSASRRATRRSQPEAHGTRRHSAPRGSNHTRSPGGLSALSRGTQCPIVTCRRLRRATGTCALGAPAAAACTGGAGPHAAAWVSTSYGWVTVTCEGRTGRSERRRRTPRSMRSGWISAGRSSPSSWGMELSNMNLYRALCFLLPTGFAGAACFRFQVTISSLQGQESL